jgi:hypothetical protein
MKTFISSPSMNEQSIIPLQLLYTHRMKIAAVGLAVAILSALGSGPSFIPPVFKAEAVIYPPSNTNSRMTADYDLRFGGDKEIEEHMQVLNSVILRDTMIARYRLMQHYGIDAGRPDKMSKLFREYADNVKIERTQFNSIKITVFDGSPQLAAAMANDLVHSGDRIKAQIIRANLMNTYENLKQQMADKNREINERIAEGTGIQGMEAIKDLMISPDNYSDLLLASVEIQKLAGRERQVGHTAQENLLLRLMSLISEKYELDKSLHQAIVNLNAKLSDSFVISPARIPDKKTYPVRWVLVLALTFSSLVFSVAYLLLHAQWKRLKNQLR